MTQQLSAGIFSPYPSFWVDERMNREKGSDGPIRANMEGRESRKLLATEIVVHTSYEYWFIAHVLIVMGVDQTLN